MGNCSHKSKPHFWSRRGNGNTKLGRQTACPKCGLIFSPNSTYNALNNHLDLCLAQENLSVSDDPISVMSIPAEVLAINANFYWCKRPSPVNPFAFVWEKRPYKIDRSQVEKIVSLCLKDAMNLDFEGKQIWFYNQIEKLRISWMNGSHQLQLRKSFILEDTLKKIESLDMHKELKISFLDDKVLDAGGLMREWVFLIMKSFIDSGLFEKADTPELTYRFRGENDGIQGFQEKAKAFGIVMAKAIFEKVPLQVYFDRTFIRCLLSQEVEINDIYSYDQGLFKSWQFMKENNLDEFGSGGLDETFEVFCKRKGVLESIELKKDGKNVKITESNKDEYLQLVMDFFTKQMIIGQLTALLEGFYKVLPLNIVQVFEPIEFEMILNGTPIINLDDWKNNTIFKGAYYQNHQIIKWFWEVLSTFSQNQLGRVLHFCTGSSRTPIDGFRNLMSNRGNIAKFCIESAKYSKENVFPRGHTCFNRLELPMYSSKEELAQKMQFIANNELEGVFGLE